MYIEKFLDLRVQLMKNGGKNKSVALNFGRCINYDYCLNELLICCLLIVR